MKVTALGVMQMSGKARKTGNDYLLSRLYIAQATTNDARQNQTILRNGFEGVEIEIPNDLYKPLQNLEFPIVLDLDTTQRNRDGRIVMEVTGARKSSDKPFS